MSRKTFLRTLIFLSYTLNLSTYAAGRYKNVTGEELKNITLALQDCAKVLVKDQPATYEEAFRIQLIKSLSLILYEITRDEEQLEASLFVLVIVGLATQLR